MPYNTLVKALEAAAKSEQGVRFLDRKANAEYLRYSLILKRALSVAGGLRRLGLNQGDRVAVILPTAPSFFDAFFGAMLAGAVPVPMYPPLRIGRLDEYHERTGSMIRAVGARLVITDSKIHHLLGKVVELATPDLGCALIEKIDCRTEYRASINHDDLAFIQFSSGTTAHPKPVCLTHGQVLANVRALLAAMDRAYPPSSELQHSAVSWLPLYHDMGLVGGVFGAIVHTGDLTLIPPQLFIAQPSLWLRTISKYRATISMAPNFAYALCADRVSDKELRGIDLSSWLIALNGAEPVTPAVLERFLVRFAPSGFRREALSPVYGLAEATLAVTFSDLKRSFAWTDFDGDELAEHGHVRISSEAAHRHPLASVGKPLPGFEVQIVDNNAVPLGENRLGHVWIKGPSIMTGYLGMPKANESSFKAGWLVSGDTGFIRAGELYLYGRHKDLIVLRGRNYAPQDIEQIVDTVADVRLGCSAAFGVVQPQGDGEQLVVLVERARSADLAYKELAAKVSRQIVSRCGLVAAEVMIIEPGTLPRTSSGKIRRAHARYQYLTNRLEAAKPVTTRRLLTAMAKSSFSFMRLKKLDNNTEQTKTL